MAVKEIENNEFVVFDPLLILPGKCPICNPTRQIIQIAHLLPENYFKFRRTHPLIMCNPQETGNLIEQDLPEDPSALEETIKKIAEAEDKYLQENNAKQIGIIQDLIVFETQMSDGTRKRKLCERIKAIHTPPR